MNEFPLPAEVGNWILSKKYENTYCYKSRSSVLASVNFEKGSINFGTIIPCGCSFGRKYFTTEEEFLEVLGVTNYPPIGK